jgi:hypothetical protein
MWQADLRESKLIDDVPGLGAQGRVFARAGEVGQFGE